MNGTGQLSNPTPGQLRLRLGRIRVSGGHRTLILGAVLLPVLLTLCLGSLASGSITLGYGEIFAALGQQALDSRSERIIWGIRLPRVVTGITVGLALGAAGAVFQSVSRNALGSPDIIGFTTGAATGAVVQIVFFDRGAAATALAATASGMLTALVVYLLARRQGSSGGSRLVLIGIGVAAMLSALNTMVLAHGELDLAVKARIWLSGSLNSRDWSDAMPVLLVLATALPLLVWLSRRLDILEMGDDQARQLGINTEQVRLGTMFLGVALTAAAVAAAGPIAFIALAAPQLVRQLTRAAKVQVISAALMGAVLLVAADLISIRLPVALALPVGLTTGMIGGLYLLLLLSRQKTV